MFLLILFRYLNVKKTSIYKFDFHTSTQPQILMVDK